MLDRAQDILKQLQQRVRTTVQVVVDVAESVGVPPTVTSWLRSDESVEAPGPFGPLGQSDGQSVGLVPPALDLSSRVTPSSATPAPTTPAPAPEASPPKAPRKTGAAAGARKKKARRASARKRSLATNQQLPAGVRSLEPDSAIGGSTYLARIVWALGVARAEGAGALRPADIARMVMARSAVSLEPPNVARYIRRSRPSCLKVDRKEGSSSFYKLNTEGRRLFDEHFRLG